ncbi:hypothetical protein [Nostoc sp.]|uniref:hypothetical protein n=1 Tax=Nostoc sp. TaxID=1180 RepID=UPI002FF885C6
MSKARGLRLAFWPPMNQPYLAVSQLPAIADINKIAKFGISQPTAKPVITIKTGYYKCLSK